MRDLSHSLGTVNAIPPQVIAASPVSSAVIDLQGFNGAALAVTSGAVTDGAYVASLTHGDAANGSDQADASASVLGSLPTFAATDDNAVKRFGYAGPHRYLRLTLTPSAATVGGIFSALAILGHPASSPVA
ncbi:MAG: hypothetical protein WCJ64_05735 [Rhodospirillaceae bacterium]